MEQGGCLIKFLQHSVAMIGSVTWGVSAAFGAFRGWTSARYWAVKERERFLDRVESPQLVLSVAALVLWQLLPLPSHSRAQ